MAAQSLPETSHFVDRERFDRSFRGGDIVSEVLAPHVGLPEFTRFPILVKQKVGRKESKEEKTTS